MRRIIWRSEQQFKNEAQSTMMIRLPHATRRWMLTIGPTFLSAISVSAHGEEARQLPEMTVEGESVDGPAIFQIDLEQAPITTPDEDLKAILG